MEGKDGLKTLILYLKFINLKLIKTNKKYG